MGCTKPWIYGSCPPHLDPAPTSTVCFCRTHGIARFRPELCLRTAYVWVSPNHSRIASSQRVSVFSPEAAPHYVVFPSTKRDHSATCPSVHPVKPRAALPFPSPLAET